jgi:hypothetical protein
MADDLTTPPPAPRSYLGDGLYAEFDGFQIRLWCDRGDSIHEVYLEPDVVAEFLRYIERLKGGPVAT